MGTNRESTSLTDAERILAKKNFIFLKLFVYLKLMMTKIWIDKKFGMMSQTVLLILIQDVILYSYWHLCM